MFKVTDGAKDRTKIRKYPIASIVNKPRALSQMFEYPVTSNR